MIRRAVAWAAVALSLLAALVAAAASPAVPDMGTVEVAARDSGLPKDWQRKGVFVENLVRACQDSDGDGTGDLNGVTSRLDYLKDLGVRGIWRMPIFRSADRDHGYAVVNYREIEPDYGTLADLDRLLAETHKRGIGVIVDYVINHSSAAHPAFEDAYDSPRSRFTEWYVFSDTAQKGWNTFSGDPWREANSRWYYAVFDAGMPDFNLRNPEVVDFHLDNLRFWLNRGVDGFRFDAVGVLFENRAVAWENQPENHLLMRRIQGLLAQYPNRTMVCEAPGDPAAFAAVDSCGSLIALRNAEPALALGSFAPMSQKDEPVFAFKRTHEGGLVLVLINLAYRDAALALPADFEPARWQPAFPPGAALDVRTKTAQKPPPGGKSARPQLEVRLGPQQVLVLKAVP